MFYFRQIAIDVPRMSPLVGLFQQRCVQVMNRNFLLFLRCYKISRRGYESVTTIVNPKPESLDCGMGSMFVSGFHFDLQDFYRIR